MVGAPFRGGVAGATALVLAFTLFAAVPRADAQDARLVADCVQPKLSDKADDATPATSTMSCELRATDVAAFQSVKAAIKGKTEPVEATFKAFDAKEQSSSVLFLIQILHPQRARTAQLMADTVLKIAEAREGKRRFAAYSIANDFTQVAGFEAPKADFDKAVRAIRQQELPTQLFQGCLAAIDKLAKEPAGRRSLVIVGDGNSDDTGYTHEKVIAAAREAGVTIHVLGFIDVVTEQPRFQILKRLAEDTGGLRREVRVGRDTKFTPTAKFASEVLENGGRLEITLKEAGGPATLTLTADLGNNQSASIDEQITVPAAPAKQSVLQVPQKTTEPTVPASWEERIAKWVKENRVITYAIGAGFGLAALGFLLFAFGRSKAIPATVTTNSSGVTTGSSKPAVTYGWLEMLDGNTTRYPLTTTNVRIGRHRDNDVCLHNETISRRHAVLHYNADTKRFVITDLGGNNGVVVNNVRQKSHELADDDLIELGEVRLRFKPNPQFLA